MRDSLRDSLLSQTRQQRRVLTTSSNENDNRQQQPRGYLRSFFAFVVLVWSTVVVAVTNAARNVTTRRPKSMRVSAKNDDVADLESGSTVVAATEPSSDCQSKDSRLMSLDFFCESGSFRAPSSMSARCDGKESETGAKGKYDPARTSKPLPVAAKMKADAREERHLTTTETMDNLQDEIEMLAIISKYTTTASEPDTPMLGEKGSTPILGDMEEVEIRLSPSVVGHHSGLEQMPISVPMRKSSGVSKQQRALSVVGGDDVDEASAFPILGSANESKIRTSFVGKRDEVVHEPANAATDRDDMQQKAVTTQEAPIVTRGEDMEAASTFPLLGGDAGKSDIKTSLSFVGKRGDVVQEPVDVTMQHEQQKTAASKQDAPCVTCGEKVDAPSTFPIFSGGIEEAQIRSSASSLVRELASVLTLEPAKAPMQREQKQAKAVVAKQVAPFPVRGEDMDPSSTIPILGGEEKVQIRSNAPLASRRGGVVRELANFLMQRQQKIKQQDIRTKKEAEFAARGEDMDEASTIPILYGGGEKAKIQSTPSFAGRRGDIEPASISMRHEQQQPKTVKKLGVPFAVQGKYLDAASTIPILGDGEKTQVRSFADRFGGAVRELASVVMQCEQKQPQKTTATKQEASFVSQGGEVDAASTIPILDGSKMEVKVRSSTSFVGRRDDVVQEPVSHPNECEQEQDKKTVEEVPFLPRGEDMDAVLVYPILCAGEEVAIRSSPFLGSRGDVVRKSANVPMLESSDVTMQCEETKKLQISHVAHDDDMDEVSTFPIVGDGEKAQIRSNAPLASRRGGVVRELASVFTQRQQNKRQDLLTKQEAPFVTRGEEVDTASALSILSDGVEEAQIRSSLSFAGRRCDGAQEPISSPMLEPAGVPIQSEELPMIVTRQEVPFVVRGEDEDETPTFPKDVANRSSPSFVGRHDSIMRELASVLMQREQKKQKAVVVKKRLLFVDHEGVDNALMIPMLDVGMEETEIRSNPSFVGQGDHIVRELASAQVLKPSSVSIQHEQKQRQKTVVMEQKDSFALRGEDVDDPPTFPIVNGGVEEAQIQSSQSSFGRGGNAVQESASAPMLKRVSAPMQREQRQEKTAVTELGVSFPVRGEDVNGASTIPILIDGDKSQIRSRPSLAGRGGVVRELANALMQRQQRIFVEKQETSFVTRGEDVDAASAIPIFGGSVEEAKIRMSSSFVDKLGVVSQESVSVPILEPRGAPTQREEEQQETVFPGQEFSFLASGKEVDVAATFPVPSGDVDEMEIQSRPPFMGKLNDVAQKPASAPMREPVSALTQSEERQPKVVALKQESSFVTRSEYVDAALTFPILGDAEEAKVSSKPSSVGHRSIMQEPDNVPTQREHKQQKTGETRQESSFMTRGEGMDDASAFTFLVGGAEKVEIRSSLSFTGRRGNSVQEPTNAPMQHDEEQKVIRKQEAPFVTRGEDMDAASMFPILGIMKPSNAPMLETTDVVVRCEQQETMTKKEAHVTRIENADAASVGFETLEGVDASNTIQDDDDEEMKPFLPMQTGEAENRASGELQNHEFAKTCGTLQNNSDEEMKPATLMQTGEANDHDEEMKPAAPMQNEEVKPRKFTIEDRAKIKEALDLFEMKQMQEAAESGAEAEMDVAVCCPVQ
ncbi:hypothetical protein FI667_g11320, partial [Globisporangium splendens]